MEKRPGTYVIILEATKGFNITAGKLGRLTGRSGFYAYAGSAFGPGGVSARVKHHRQITPSPHWHIDYLRVKLRFNEAWYTHDPRKRECEWTRTLRAMKGALAPFHGFGASDCTCPTHLIYFKTHPSFQGFRKRLYSSKVKHAPVRRLTSTNLAEL